MTSKEVKKILELIKQECWDIVCIENQKICEACDFAISALKKQEQSCETCRHGRFGDEACINCRVGFPNHYEGVEES